METCVAPDCARPVSSSSVPLCTRHLKAPAVQRGGWLSAAKRRARFAPAIDVAASEIYDASNVAPKLWVGAKPPLDRSYPGVDMIVLCAAEYQPRSFPHFQKTIVHCPLIDDALDPTQRTWAIGAGHKVAVALRAQQRVLVTCMQGRNRSALVAALALGQITRASSQQIVELIREKRMQTCLTNPHFVEYLERFVRGRSR